MDGLEHEDCHADFPADLSPPPKELLDICFELYQRYICEGKITNKLQIYCAAWIFSVSILRTGHLDDYAHRGLRNECF